ncbi:MAG: glycosyltransferase family 4 protein [Deltaproteobacteria bacterium]|nr:glycosyltransferase family 4 protein [Deltaproteobacteria bacterium]
MKKLRLLFLAWNFPPVLGGIEYVAKHLYAGLEAAGHDVRVVAPYAEDTPVHSHIFRCPRAGLRAFLWYAFAQGYRIGRRLRPDVIVCPSIVSAPAAFLLSSLLRCPYVVLVHGTDMLRKGRMYRGIVRFLVRGAGRLAANSRHTKKLLQATGCRSGRVKVIYPGVSCEAFEAVPVEDPLPFLARLEGRRILLSVGRLIRRKGIIEFVTHAMPELVRIFPDIAFVVVGDDATASLIHKERIRAQIERDVRRLGLVDHVYLLGRLQNEGDVLQLYRRADVFVLPCLDIPDDVEGFGIVFLEAALAGAPSVATRVGGIPEALLDGHTGLLTNPGDFPELVSAISKLLQDESLRRRLARQGAQRAGEKFDWSVIIPQYAALFEQSRKRNADGKRPLI